MKGAHTMEALRLIRTARHALAEARSVQDVVQEAWQAAMLTEALAGQLGEHPVAEVAALAHLLAEAGGHAGGCLEVPSDPPEPGEQGEWAPTGRAARLSEVGDPEPVLWQLRQLLNEASEALIIVACGAETESVYWQCIDGVDANAECRDLLAELLRVLRQLDPGQEPEAGAQAPPEPGTPSAEAAATLLLPLGPPAAPLAWRYQDAESAEASAEARSSASRPARSAFTEASSSCICSSRVLGAAVGAAAGGRACAGAVGCCVCGAAGASYLGSDMRGTLQLGGAM
ncbi:hypothetical protein P3T37_000950 [Kitasatospora sp. MAA4]|uniref:DUF6099 family protein n=1 Tax=Kitasatospora sp. MAA4 TaxID=3035093 RepID=UPI00247F15A6|nr:hypothetical protein [Kitasatospora sp. MAA4]